MQYLKRNNKLPEFVGKTPLIFFEDNHKESIIYAIDRTRRNECWNTIISEKLDIGRKIDNWWCSNYSSNKLSTSYGLIVNTKRVIAIAVKDSNDKIEIYCNSFYFNQNESHKKYINKFARDLGISVRKDIHYINDDVINSWINPLTIDLNFYDREVQDKVSEDFFNEMKIIHPIEEPVVECEFAGDPIVPVEILAC